MPAIPSQRGAVLITGTSTGIGRATAILLAKRGYRVFAGVRREEDGLSLQRAMPERVVPLVLDVTRPDDIVAAAAEVRRLTGPDGLRALINNAGLNYTMPFEFTEPERASQVLDANLMGPYRLMQTFLPDLRRAAASGRPATIVNVGSIGSLVGIPWEPFYHASKFALLGLSESIRHEVYSQGIRVTVVMPGGIKTPFIKKTVDDTGVSLEKMTPEGRKLYSAGLSAFARMAVLVDRFGSSPEAAANRILRMIEARNPPLTAFVGADARLMNLMRVLLPRPAFHRLLRSSFGC